MISSALSKKTHSTQVKSNKGDAKFTSDKNIDGTKSIHETALNFCTMQKIITWRIIKKIAKVVDTVEDKIRKAILTALVLSYLGSRYRLDQ